MELENLTITDLAPKIANREVSPVELTQAFLERIDRLDTDLHAFVTLTADQARADAKLAEAEIHAGLHRGSLHGIPFSIKDNLATAGVRTTAGSKMLADWIPDVDATVVTRLKEAGAIVLGKANMHEWAAGCSTINPYYGTTRNPWDRNRVAGGSSGGSAAGVAAGMALGSIGTDNAGSVRNPASHCGIVGLKATYGRVSRFGGVAGTGGYSTDHFGVFARTVRDSATILQCIAGHDEKDPLSSDALVPRFAERIGDDVKGLRVGVIQGYFDDFVVEEVKDAVTAALSVLESLGMSVQELTIPYVEYIAPAQLCTARVENLSPAEHFLRNCPRDYSPELLHRQVRALTIPAATYVTAQRVRSLISAAFEEAFEKVDVIVSPAVNIPAPTIDECNRGFVELGGKKIPMQDARGNWGTLCAIPFNMTGSPAMSVPGGFSALGLPIGLQLAANNFQEVKLLQVAHAYEEATRWYEKRPPIT
jgi:aspartyl-tRNA(Asn)/glutamyl-tRNA(Gln) amidotransferase subunit A